MRVAYADPPYLGTSAFGAVHHYGEHHAEAADWNDPETHRRLVGQLSSDFDAWALSLHSPSLRIILPMCPENVRVGAWVKPFAFFKPGVNPSYAWEPVIFRGGRKRGKGSGLLRDWVSANVMGHHARSKVTVDGKPFSGAKPPEFCWWVFGFLGMEPEDELHDLFPGSGAVGHAWDAYRRSLHTTPLFADLRE
jgi:hypothetical protein